MSSLGKSRSDCSSQCIDALIRVVSEIQDIPGDIVECGSYRCGATIALASAAPIKHVYAFDLFGGLPYGDGVGFENFGSTDFEEIQAAVAPYKNISLIRGLHEETVPAFPAKSLSMIFMDSDFYSSHKICLNHFWPMLCSGGVIIFHDWSFDGVQKAIEEEIPSPRTVRLFNDNEMGGIVKI